MPRASRASLWTLVIGVMFIHALVMPAPAAQGELLQLAAFTAEKAAPSQSTVTASQTREKKAAPAEAPASTAVKKTRSPCYWADLEWDQMKASDRRAWTRLGWTRMRWDGGMAPASDRKDWSQLTEEEKDAVRSLGITPDGWDHSGC